MVDEPVPPEPVPPTPAPPEVSETAVGDLTPKVPTATLAEAYDVGYLGVPTDTSDDYVYTANGVSGVPKPDPGP